MRDEDGGGLTDVDIRDELITFVLAGHETTSSALTWCWYLLAQHPAAEARMHAELDAVLGDRAPGLDDETMAFFKKPLADGSMRPVMQSAIGRIGEQISCPTSTLHGPGVWLMRPPWRVRPASSAKSPGRSRRAVRATRP